MKRRCQPGHQVLKGRGCQSEVVSVSTLDWLQEIQAVRVPWDNCLLEPSQARVESHRKKKAARWTALSYSSGQKNLSTSRSCDFHVRSAVVVILRRKRQIKPGNSVLSSTKSVNGTPDSCGAHATWARAVVSVSWMLSVFCLFEMHLCE